MLDFVDVDHGNFEVAIFKNVPSTLSHAPVRNFKVTAKFKTRFPPSATCITPPVTTVSFGYVPGAELDAEGQGSTTAYRPFSLTFRRCPNTNINWYIHANNKYAISSLGIVGMPGSFPDTDPAIGNPRHFGVQLAHNGGIHGAGFIYIANNETDSNKQVYGRTPSDGDNTQAGITHTIPLRVRLVRTSPGIYPIQPGPFNTSVVFVIQYP